MMRKKRILRKVAAFLLMVAMLAPITSAGAAHVGVADFTDLPQPGYWAYEGIVSVIENSIMEGYGDGTFRPDGIITLAEASAYITRVMRAEDRATDMPGISGFAVGSWYDEQGVIASAYQMGVLDGIITTYGSVTPETQLTSEDAFDIMARSIMASEGNLGVLDILTDGSAVSAAYRASIAALLTSGHVEGHQNPDGTRSLAPHEPITRARFAAVFGRMFQQYVKDAGEYGQNDIYGANVVVSAPDVTLKNLTVAGDLIIADGVGIGPVTLDNVRIDGRLVVRSSEGSVIEAQPTQPPDEATQPPTDAPTQDDALPPPPSFYSSTSYFAFLTSAQIQRNTDGTAAAQFLVGHTLTPALTFIIERGSADQLSANRFYRLVMRESGQWTASAVPESSIVVGYVTNASTSGFVLAPSSQSGTGGGTVLAYLPDGMPVVSALDESDGGLGFGKFLGFSQAISSAGDRMAAVILGKNAEDEVFALAAFVFSDLVDRNAAAGLG